MVAFVGLIASLNAYAAPEIDSISPLTIRKGVPTEIILSGTDLTDATRLWTSFAAQVESLGEGRVRFTTDAPVGLGALRVFGSNGVSNLGFVTIDDLPTTAESKTNKTRAAAQPIVMRSAIDGRCEELGYDWFKVRAAKGERVSLETVAARIGSKVDSVLRVVNAAGRELARNDDAPGQSGDSFLSFVAPQAGEYFVELRDANYGGGSSFFYHLRVGASAQMNSRFQNATAHETRHATEREPNDSPNKATKISITDTIEGDFGKAKDRDVYEFTAGKGEHIEFRAMTRSLGSACDAILQLDSAGGKRLARSNPSAADEGTLAYSFPSNGIYRLSVEEVTGAFGSNMFYRIVTRPAAGFALTLDTDRVNVAPGKEFELKINLVRGDYKGAVTLGSTNLSGTFTLTNNVIAAGKTNVTMRVTAPGTLVPGTWQTFSVFGTAMRDGQEVQVPVSTAPALRKVLPLRLYAPPELDGEIALGVTAR